MPGVILAVAGWRVRVVAPETNSLFPFPTDFPNR